VGLAYRGARPACLVMAQPTWAFWLEAESRGALSPIGTGSLPTKSGRSATGGHGGNDRGASPDDGGSAGVQAAMGGTQGRLVALKYLGSGCAPVSSWRSSRGCRQGGRGSSRRWCGARGGVGEFGGGPGWWFVVAQ
jgi:hypothetical protein